MIKKTKYTDALEISVFDIEQAHQRGHGGDAVRVINAVLKRAKCPVVFEPNMGKETPGFLLLGFRLTDPQDMGQNVVFAKLRGLVLTIEYNKPKPKGAKVPAVDEMVAKLKKYYHSSAREWILIKEMRVGTGYTGGAERSIDLWAINCYQSKGHKTVSYEIKRSRSDFLVDLKDAHSKHLGARAYGDKFYYVAPQGMIKVEELPCWAGLIELMPSGRMQITHEGLPGEKIPPSWDFVCSLLRRKDNIV